MLTYWHININMYIIEEITVELMVDLELLAFLNDDLSVLEVTLVYWRSHSSLFRDKIEWSQTHVIGMICCCLGPTESFGPRNFQTKEFELKERVANEDCDNTSKLWWILYLYCDERRDIQWNIAWDRGKSQVQSPRDFPRAQAIFHHISWLKSKYRHSQLQIQHWPS